MRKLKFFLCITIVIAIFSLTAFAGLAVYHMVQVHKSLDHDCSVCNVIAYYLDLRLVIFAFIALLCISIYIVRNIPIPNFRENAQLITPVTLRVKLLD